MTGDSSKASPASLPGRANLSLREAGYVVVARRYRPGAFDELIGQQPIAAALKGAIESNRVGHAYLFTGARGVGKTSAARILAKSLNCVRGPTVDPCLECDSCLGVAAGEDVDVIEIDGASNRGIDEIRELRQNVNVLASRSRFKIYIIDEVHMLTREAFNALLKTLEEPPEHVKFIFATTEVTKIPVTILSRCQRFDFAGIGLDDIKGRLREIATAEKVAIDEQALTHLARRANGSMRDSQSLLEQLLSIGKSEITVEDIHALLGTSPTSRLTNLVTMLAEHNAAGVLADLDTAIAQGVDVSLLVEQLLGYFRDVMVKAVGAKDSLLQYVEPNESKIVSELGAAIGLETVLAIVQILEQAAARMRESTIARLIAESALVRIAMLDRLDDLSTLVSAVRQGTPVAIGQTTAGAISRPSNAASPTAAQRTSAATSPSAPSSAPPRSLSQEVTAMLSGAASSNRQASSAPPPNDADLKKNRATLNDANNALLAGDSVDDDSYAGESSAHSGGGAQVQLTNENAMEVWRSVVSELPGLIADQAKLASDVAISAPNRLAVGFPARYTSFQKMLERPDQKSLLEQGLMQATGNRWSIQFEIRDSPTSAPELHKPTVQARKRNAGEVIAKPIVQRAMELFGNNEPRVDMPK